MDDTDSSNRGGDSETGMCGCGDQGDNSNRCLETGLSCRGKGDNNREDDDGGCGDQGGMRIGGRETG